MNKALLAGAAGLLVAVALVAAFFSNGAKPPSDNSSGAAQQTAPTFQNESALTNVGVTAGQLSNLEQTLEQYLSAHGNPDKVGFDSVKHVSVNRNTETPVWTISFAILLNGSKEYQAKMDYFNPSGIRLYLYNPDSTKLLYDSQNVGGSPNAY